MAKHRQPDDDEDDRSERRHRWFRTGASVGGFLLAVVRVLWP